MSGIGDVLTVLEPRSLGEGRFAADNLADSPGSVVFGGQLLGQSLIAAARTVPDKDVLSLHTVFARGASKEAPLDIAVDTMSSGRAFASVSVTISQDGKVCTRTLALLHDPSPDLIRHGDAVPPVSAADAWPPRPGGHDWWDIRIVDDVDISDPSLVGPAELRVWTRFPGAPDDRAVNQALLAWASDGFLIATAMRPHEGVGQSMAHVSISTTVLTQTLVFHEPFAAANWMLLDQRSSYAGRGRSQGSANVYDESGALVASFTQTNMIRDFPQGQAPQAGNVSKF